MSRPCLDRGLDALRELVEGESAREEVVSELEHAAFAVVIGCTKRPGHGSRSYVDSGECQAAADPWLLLRASRWSLRFAWHEHLCVAAMPGPPSESGSGPRVRSAQDTVGRIGSAKMRFVK